jgi:hypothetical protein
MTKKTGLNFRNIALGIVLATALIFVVAAIALLTDLFFDLRYTNFALRDPKPSPEEVALLSAWATLVGNMVGAAFSGVLAVIAAFGAVYLERAGEREKIRKHQAEIARLLAPWAKKKAMGISLLINDIRYWFEHPDPMEGVPLFLGYRITEFAKSSPDPKIRAVAEAEYLPLAKIFADIDDQDRSIEANANLLLEKAHARMWEVQDKRAAESPVSELVEKITFLAGRLAAVGDQIEDIETQIQAKSAYELASALELWLLKNDR